MCNHDHDNDEGVTASVLHDVLENSGLVGTNCFVTVFLFFILESRRSANRSITKDVVDDGIF